MGIELKNQKLKLQKK